MTNLRDNQIHVLVHIVKQIIEVQVILELKNQSLIKKMKVEAKAKVINDHIPKDQKVIPHHLMDIVITVVIELIIIKKKKNTSPSPRQSSSRKHHSRHHHSRHHHHRSASGSSRSGSRSRLPLRSHRKRNPFNNDNYNTYNSFNDSRYNHSHNDNYYQQRSFKKLQNKEKRKRKQQNINNSFKEKEEIQEKIAINKLATNTFKEEKYKKIKQ